MWRRTPTMFAIEVTAASRAALCKKTPAIAKASSETVIKFVDAHSAHNYHPLPVVFQKARGARVVDPEGKKYLDFLAGYGAVNQGHLHPRIVRAAVRQMRQCSLSARAFHSDVFGRYAAFVTKYFGFDRVLPMNTGAEAVETGLKIARKWAYKVKKVPQDQAIIVCCTSNFHGRTFGAISMSDDPDSYANYGPLLPGLRRVPFGDASALEALLEKEGTKVAGFIVEPVQGEAGVNIPPEGYLRAVRELCTKHNVLFIADEVQSGIGRTGKMLACDHEDVRPDILLLAKALGGGLLPVAAVLADTPIMDVIEPGTHGSTFGGNPLACAVAIESLRVIVDEKLVERSAALGELLLSELQAMQRAHPTLLKKVRGRGLFAALEFDENLIEGKAATKFMYMLRDAGVLAKTTHGNILRLSPPLVIKKKDLLHGCACIKKALADLETLTGAPLAAHPDTSSQTAN